MRDIKIAQTTVTVTATCPYCDDDMEVPIVYVDDIDYALTKCTHCTKKFYYTHPDSAAERPPIH